MEINNYTLSDESKIKHALDSFVFTYNKKFNNKDNLKKAITRTNLYKFWDNILPEKFKGKSKPYGMLPGGLMTVACQNPVVAQELSLHKVILMKKF